MKKEVRCNGCRHWFGAHQGRCPECGTARPAWNKWLRTAGLNNNLYAMAERSVSEDEAVRRTR